MLLYAFQSWPECSDVTVEKVKMAALDDSLTHFEGQKWSLWAERLGLSSPASECDCLNVRWWCPGGHSGPEDTH